MDLKFFCLSCGSTGINSKGDRCEPCKRAGRPVRSTHAPGGVEANKHCGRPTAAELDARFFDIVNSIVGLYDRRFKQGEPADEKSILDEVQAACRRNPVYGLSKDKKTGRKHVYMAANLVKGQWHMYAGPNPSLEQVKQYTPEDVINPAYILKMKADSGDSDIPERVAMWKNGRWAMRKKT